MGINMKWEELVHNAVSPRIKNLAKSLKNYDTNSVSTIIRLILTKIRSKLAKNYEKLAEF